MPEKLIIEGKNKLSGTIDVRGSKNAATPLIAACLLTTKPCTLENIPLVDDVKTMLEIIRKMGAEVNFLEKRKVKVTAKDVNPKKLDFNLVNKMRSSVLLIGPLVSRFGSAQIPHPGGCIIGARPVDTHLSGFRRMGVKIKEFSLRKNGSLHSNMYHFSAEKRLRGKEVVLNEFSPTATENILMAAVLAKGDTVIKIAASEPHVQDLAAFLRKMGAKIEGEGTSTIKVKGVEELQGADHFVSYDYVEAGTFTLLALAAKGKVRIENFPVEQLTLLLSRLKSFGARLKIEKNAVVVSPGRELKINKVQVMPYPGIPPDLQSPLGVLSTQAKGLTLIHDPLYEGRLKYLEELNKMGAEIVVCDPHRAIINGPTNLQGTKLDPLDLRSGAALIIAGAIAEGVTVIKDITQADRGYEEIDKRLQNIGVKVKRMNN